jgi:tRNA (guanine-N7-)-methyltransferase
MKEKEDGKINAEEKLIRSFGRIKSRKLSEHKEDLFQNLFKKYKFSSKVDINSDINSQYDENILEIGFGFGDFLFDKAKNNPKSQFFGFEPHINGIASLLQKLENDPCKNLKISDEDIRLKINEFEDEFFNKVYILFPDPWPKFKHFKRRLIQKEFLDGLLSSKVKKGGKIIIATDHDSDKVWILSEILKSEKFNWLADSKKDWQIFPDNWKVTKYQKKAEREGRVSVIFKLEKL